MHRLTNADADRLAHDLRDAELIARHAAHQHADLAAALAQLGSVLAAYHEHAHTNALHIAEQMRHYSERLTQRMPLWDNPIRSRTGGPRRLTASAAQAIQTARTPRQ